MPIIPVLIRKENMDKSYVTLATCPICGEENGTILMDRRLKPTFEMHTPSPEPCSGCKEKYLKEGILLLNPKNGDLVVLKITAFKRMFNVPVPEKHIAFVEAEVLERINQNAKSSN